MFSLFLDEVRSTCAFLQAGDIAFSVPDSLVVTLERVLGNETIGKVHYPFASYFIFPVLFAI